MLLAVKSSLKTTAGQFEDHLLHLNLFQRTLAYYLERVVGIFF